MEKRISTDQLDHMRSLATKGWMTQRYEGPADSLTIVDFPASELHALQSALLTTVDELERIYRYG